MSDLLLYSQESRWRRSDASGFAGCFLTSVSCAMLCTCIAAPDVACLSVASGDGVCSRFLDDTDIGVSTLDLNSSRTCILLAILFQLRGRLRQRQNARRGRLPLAPRRCVPRLLAERPQEWTRPLRVDQAWADLRGDVPR